MQPLFHENDFGYARQCTCSAAVPLHFGNVALVLNYTQVFDFLAIIFGTEVQEAGVEDRDARWIYLPTRDLALMFELQGTVNA